MDEVKLAYKTAVVIASCAVGLENAKTATELGEQAMRIFPGAYKALGKTHTRKAGGDCACDFSAYLTPFMKQYAHYFNIKSVVVDGKMVKGRNGEGERPAKLRYYLDIPKSEAQKATDAGINISQLLKELGK